MENEQGKKMDDEVKQTPAELEADAAEKALVDLGQAHVVTPDEPVVVPEEEPAPDEGTKDEKPDVTPADKKPAEKVDEEEELPEPKDGNPTPDDWKKVREIVRKHKEKIKELESKPLTVAPAAPNAPAKKEGEQPSIKDEDVFNIAVDAQVDKYKDAAKSKALLKQAQDLIDEMTPDRILGIIKKAKRNEFGDNSSDVLIMARDALVEANAREFTNSKVSAEESKKMEQTVKAVGESFERVNKKYPELNDKNNPALISFAKKWREQYIGKTDEKGQLIEAGPLASVLTGTTNWPEVVAEMVINAYKASGGVISAASNKNKTDYVPDAGGKKQGDGQPSGSADSVERELARLGSIRKG